MVDKEMIALIRDDAMELWTVWYDTDPYDHYDSRSELKAVCTTWEKVLELFPNVKWYNRKYHGKGVEKVYEDYFWGDEEDVIEQYAHYSASKGLKLNTVWE